MRIPSKTKTKLTKGQRELDVVFLDNNRCQPLRFNQRKCGFHFTNHTSHNELCIMALDFTPKLVSYSVADKRRDISGVLRPWLPVYTYESHSQCTK